MKYLLYRKKEHPTDADIPLPKGYSIHEVQPNLRRLIARKATVTEFIWFLSSFGKADIVTVLDENGRLAHKSIMIGKNYKFAFMKRGEYEIGPCATQPDYRGKGIYPAVLSYLTRKYRNTFYMLVREDNTSSIKGIEHAKFVCIGTVIKKHGRWKEENG